MSIDVVLKTIDALMQRPCTVGDLIAHTGTNEHTIRRQLDALKQRDRVEFGGFRTGGHGIKPAVWRWKAKP